jgi:IMP dehydrogenase
MNIEQTNADALVCIPTAASGQGILNYEVGHKTSIARHFCPISLFKIPCSSVLHSFPISLHMATRNSSPAKDKSPVIRERRTSNGKFFGEGLTFDDVLLVPGFSQVVPRDVNIRSRLTKDITLNVPMLSAAMDTVTEAALAIALAREGGVGILHKNMSIEKQAEQVRKVKRSESGLILDPITLTADATVGDAHRLVREHKIGGIPIVDKNGKLVGILTNRDLRFEDDPKRKVSEVMTSKNLITAPDGTDMKKAEVILRQHKVEKLPVVDKNYKLIGLLTYRDILQLKSFPNAVKDSFGRLLVGAGVGITKDLMDRVAALQHVGVDVIALDSAHGHSKGVIQALKDVKKNFKKLNVIAGNVGTAAGAKALADAGADAVKVGIGPGSICTTRIVAGAGVPQLTAVMEAASALKQKNIPVIADGGIRYTGDMVKALAAGADCVMMGSIFAGTEESPGETIIYEGRKFKEYRGMGSMGAMATGSSDRYFQDVEDDVKKFVPEGIEGRVAYKGTLKEIVYQYVGGLRAGMGYCGAKDIAELKQATFVKITNAGMRESHAHDIEITKEAPNYSRR